MFVRAEVGQGQYNSGNGNPRHGIGGGFANEATGYCALRLDHILTAVGVAPMVAVEKKVKKK